MMERATLESFLAPISRQLGHTSVPNEAPPIECGADAPARRTDGLSHPQLVTMFGEEAEKIRVGVHHGAPEDIASIITGIIEHDVEPGEIVFANDKRMDKLGIPEALAACQAVEKATRWNADAGREAMIAACNEARYGITYAQGGIAETGTIVQPCSVNCGRSVSLLPLVHIALVDAKDIKATMGDWLAELDRQGAPQGDALPSQVCFISGPSVTSDIELVRVEGVHGPMFVHYVIVER